MRLRILGRRHGRLGRRACANVKSADRLGDVLERLLARRLVSEGELVPDAVVHGAGYADAAGLAHLLQPRRDVDAVAVDVVALDHHIAEVNADAELKAPLLGQVGVAPTEIVLDLGGARNGVGDRAELGQERVAGRADHTAAAALDARCHGGPVFGERTQGRLLVGAHEAGISRDVGGEDGGESATDGFGLHETDRCRWFESRVPDRPSPSRRPMH